MKFHLLTLSYLLLFHITADAIGQTDVVPLERFVRRAGDKLVDGDQEFRFISFNIPNLHVIEDSLAFGKFAPWRWPNEFEIEDALESVRQMGGRVVRTYVISVYREGSSAGDHVHVRGPGEFNEQAFRALDRVLEVANRKGIRVIIPLVDNWHWWGGIKDYAAFRGSGPEDFWTDPRLFEDFQKTIEFVITRKNSLTGVAYRDDKAILAWETGNELDSPFAWTQRTAAFIKSLDPNHLVVDGNSLHGLSAPALDDDNIDVVTTHHYPGERKSMVDDVRVACQQASGKKPYFVGEFGFVDTDTVRAVVDTVIRQRASGALLWSLRFHSRDGGFYWHSEGAGDDLYRAYHWPGFASGKPYDERAVMSLMRNRAFKIRDWKVPARDAPSPAILLPIERPGQISWRGSAGASSYDIQRSATASGPWTTIATDVSDAAYPYRPQFGDSTAKPGSSYFYRVLAKNSGGVADPSNVTGPLTPSHYELVDEVESPDLMRSLSGNAEFATKRCRDYLEDMHRLVIHGATALEYHLDGPVREVSVYCFSRQPSFSVRCYASDQGQSAVQVPLQRTGFDGAASDYDYSRPYLFRGTLPATNLKDVKLEFDVGNQNRTARQSGKLLPAVHVTRIEIRYGGPNGK